MKALLFSVLIFSAVALQAQTELVKNSELQEGQFKLTGNTKINCQLRISKSEFVKNGEKFWLYSLILSGAHEGHKIMKSLALLVQHNDKHVVDSFYLYSKRVSIRSDEYSRFEFACSSSLKEVRNLVGMIGDPKEWKLWSEHLGNYGGLNKHHVGGYYGGPENTVYFGLNVRSSTCFDGNIKAIPVAIKKYQTDVRGVIRVLNDMNRRKNSKLTEVQDSECAQELSLYLRTIFAQETKTKSES